MNEEMLELEIEKVLNFIENKKFNDLRKYLETVNSADFPSMFEELEEEQILLIYRLLAKEQHRFQWIRGAGLRKAGSLQLP